MKPGWILSLAVSLALCAPAARAESDTALIDAAYRGDLNTLQEVLKAGAAISTVDARGYTALHWAAREGHAKIAQELIGHGIPLDARDRDGETALMLAASYGQVEVVKLLLACGAALEPKDRDGHTVVDLAVAGGVDALIVVVQEAANGLRPTAASVAGTAGAVDDLAFLGLDERMRTLGPRLDALPFAGMPLEAPKALPLADWTGQKFMFLPMERDNPDEAPSFTLGAERPSPEARNAPYESLVGRLGTVIRTGHVLSGGEFVVMRMDDDGAMLRGSTGPRGNLPELAPALDLYVARKLYTGKILWPKDNAIDRYTRARGAEARIKLGAGVPLVVRGVFPAETAANPVRLVLETSDGRQGYLDVTLSGTNAPLAGDGRRVFRFDDMFFAGDPRHTTGWSNAAWAAIRAERVLPGFVPDQVRAAWGRPERFEGLGADQTWIYADPRRLVRFAGGRVAEVQR
jgi:hypothetical protein